MNLPTIGFSNYAVENAKESCGNSYTSLLPDELIELILGCWDDRIPGDGEGENLDRKVLVPVPPENFFCPLRVELESSVPVQAKVSIRPGQEETGEKPHVETWVEYKDAINHNLIETPANNVSIVCYSAEALQENGGTRSTDCDWEIVTILASIDAQEPMHPLTMARNFLGEEGGTLSNYTSEEFAKSIWFHSRKGMKVKQTL